jgi:tryptophan-rich sensory protein
MTALRRSRVLALSAGFAAVILVYAGPAWSYLFGQAHALAWAAVVLLVAAALTWLLLVVVGRAGGGYAAGLLVYAVWMTLAASLSLGYVVLN